MKNRILLSILCGLFVLMVFGCADNDSQISAIEDIARVDCVYTISSSAATYTAAGGTGSVDVTTLAGCDWTAVSSNDWITVTSGEAGSGTGTVEYSVAANSSVDSRTGTITIAGNTFTVAQGGVGCTYTINLNSASYDATGGSGTVGVTALSGCAWTAASNDGWIHITSGATGSGNGTVHYTVDPNLSITLKTGTMTIAGKTFTVTQEGAECTYAIVPDAATFTAAGGIGSVAVTTLDGCEWTAESNDDWIHVTSGATGSESGTVEYTVDENESIESRIGTMTIAGKTFTVAQGKADCTYAINPDNATYDYSGGSGSVEVTSLDGCAWAAASNDSWIEITSDTTGSGDGTVNYTVAENLALDSRTGTMTIAGKTFTVTQSGFEKWRAEIFEAPPYDLRGMIGGIEIISSPAVAPDGTIYIGSYDGSLYSFSSDGTLNWKYETGGEIVASPVIGGDGTIYIGSADRQFYAINPDGTLKWTYPTKTVFSSSAALALDGTIYVGGTYLDKIQIVCSETKVLAVQLGELYAINPDGTLKWSVTLSGVVNSSPAVASDGTIYIGSSGDIDFDRGSCDDAAEYPSDDVDGSLPVNGHLYSIEPDFGLVKWDFRLLGDVDSSPAITDDGMTIYIGSDYGTHAFGADHTKLIPIGSATTGYLYAITSDGILEWITDLFGDVNSSPAIGSDGTIYVGSDKEDVFAVDPFDGSLIWWYPTRGPVKSSPAIAADGTIYIGSNDGSLYLLNPNGTLNLRLATDVAWVNSSPAIAPDGTVYFAAEAKSHNPTYLYAIIGGSPLAETPWPKFRHDLLNTGSIEIELPD